jgi:glycosyltransferase involved in cell wall biosynthesis
MKLLMIAPQPFFQPRGTPFSILHRLRALSALGHEVDLLTYPIGEDRAIEGVRILRSGGVPGVHNVKVGPSLRKIPLDLRLFSRVLRQVRRERYDAVHTHEEACFLGAWIARRRGLPHVYDMHSSLPQQLENYGFLAYRPVLRLGRAVERFVLRHSHGVIAICESLRDIALAQGADPARLFLIHNRPVDEGPLPSESEIAAFRARLGVEHGKDLERRPLVLYTGTFEKNQGLDMLVRAFARSEAAQAAALVLVGGTPEQVSALRADARGAGIEERCLVLGRRPVEEMGLWMGCAAVLCSSRTRGTNTPLKVYSYLRAGRAILATDLETHRQVLDEQTALLVQPTEEGLAEGVERLLRDTPLRLRLAMQAQSVARERFSEEHYLERHREMFRILFETAAPRPGLVAG